MSGSKVGLTPRDPEFGSMHCGVEVQVKMAAFTDPPAVTPFVQDLRMNTEAEALKLFFWHI